MKLKSGFVLRKIADHYMAVPVGNRMNDLHGMIALNETGAFIWERLKDDLLPEELASAICSEYNISFEDALEAVNNFTILLKKEHVLEGSD